MKKNLKIAALIMVLALCFSCFTACNEEKSNKSVETSESKNDETEDVREVAEAYFEANLEEIDELDDCWENVEEFVAKDSEVYKDYTDDSEEQDEIIEGLVESFYCSDSFAEEVMVAQYNELCKETEYKIDKIEIDNNKATVTYTVETLDLENTDEADNDVNLEYMKALENYVLEYWEEGTWELVQTNSDVREQVLSEYCVDCHDELLDLFSSYYLKKLETIKRDGTLTLEKNDNKWLVTENEQNE